MNPESRWRAGRPCFEGSKSRNRLSKAHARPAFFLYALSGGHMRRGLIPFLALGVFLTDCQDAERSLAPRVDGAQFSLPAAAGLRGTIAFHSNRDGDFDIYVMNADGSNVTQVTQNDINEFDPIWSPDGKQIAFGRCLDVCDVVVINADGSGERVIFHDGFPGAWSPDGTRIAFASNRNGGDEVFVMNADGSVITQLTHNDFVRDFPTAWSPNGKQIRFQSDRDGNTELYVMNVDGTHVTRLTNNDASDEGDHAGWSPDGRRILFSSTRDGGDLDIFVMNADGTGVNQLTHNDFIADDDPVWSPDGKQIAFHSTRDGDEDIFVMNADGTGVIQLTNTSVLPDGSPIFDAVPAWTAGTRNEARGPCLRPPAGLRGWWPGDGDVGDRIGGNHGIGTFNVYVMTADGTNPTRLTQGGAVDQLPTWSPDGARIAFQTNRDGNNEVYVMNADGSNPINLTQSPAADEFPAWSPLGDKIAFRSDRDGNGEIYVINLDGSQPTRLTNTPAEEYYPAWSPTGSGIAFVSNRDGNFEIYLMKPDGSAQKRVTSNPAWDAAPAWAIGRGDDPVLTFASARATFAPAKVGEGFSFNGAGNGVFAPGAGIDNLQQLTIDAWVQHNSLAPGRVQRYVSLTNEKAVLRYDGAAGPAQLHFYMRIDGQLQHIRVDNILRVGVFQHVAGSYDGAVMRLYLDGVEVGSLPVRGTVDAGDGVIFSSGHEPLDGLLDEIEIFDRALDASEVHAIFAAGAAGKCKNPSGI